MDYNINFKYKSGGGTASSGMSAITGARQKAMQANTKQNATLRPDENSRKLIDTNIKLSTNILKLNQSIAMLTGVIKNRGLGGGGGGGSPALGGNSGLGSVGSALGYIGVPVALAGFAIQKINQIGSAYIEKVSQQKGTVGVGGFRKEREGAYLGPEVGAAYKAHRMAVGKFTGEVDPMAFKMGTIFGQSAEEVGTQSGQIARYGKSYGDIAATGMGAGIETDLPKFMQAIAGELEDAVKNGVNSSNMSSDIGDELSVLTSKTNTKSVEMALGIVSKTKASKESASMGQIGGVESLMTWKAGQTKLLEELNAPNAKKSQKINSLIGQGLLTDAEGVELLKKDKVDEQFIRNKIGQSGFSTLVRNEIDSMNSVESARLSMKETQKSLKLPEGVEGMRRLNAILPQYGSSLKTSEVQALYATVNDPEAFKKVMESQDVGRQKLQQKFTQVEGFEPMLGVQKAQMMDNLLYKHGPMLAEASLKLEKTLIKMADSLATTAKSVIDTLSGGNILSAEERAAVQQRMNNTPMSTWGDDLSGGL